MNSVKLQDTKSIYRNQLCSYILITIRKRSVKKKKPVDNCIKKSKISRNKYSMLGVWLTACDMLELWLPLAFQGDGTILNPPSVKLMNTSVAGLEAPEL